MEKIKSFFRKKSIKTSFALYMLTGILLAVLLSLLLSSICQLIQHQIYKKHEIEYKSYYVEMKIEPYDGHTIGYYTEDLSSLFSPTERKLYDFMGFFSVGVYPLCFIFCIAATSALFYKRQLQKPLTLLDHAAKQIADNNLDFQVVYSREDELGRLCDSFEKMRLALLANNEEMWRQMEERKRLNAAFSHDLRTPLTVLRGQSELLIQYAPKMTVEKVADTSEMMRRHVARLEAYVQTMGELQRLEDIEIIRQPIPLSALYEQLLETGEVLCAGKKFSGSLTGDEHTILNVDASIAQRVFENLLSNAARFAKERIAASIASKEGYLFLIISDDGNGFAQKDLEHATKPFYKTVRETDNEHFGMGLNICKILCEKHGGSIHLSNQNGAVITAVFKE